MQKSDQATAIFATVVIYGFLRTRRRMNQNSISDVSTSKRAACVAFARTDTTRRRGSESLCRQGSGMSLALGNDADILGIVAVRGMTVPLG